MAAARVSARGVVWAWGLLGALAAGALEPPRLLRGEAPLLTGRDARATVLLEARVNAEGSVTGVRALTPGTPDGRAWKRALGRFRFRPAQADGEALPARLLVVGWAGATGSEPTTPAPEDARARGELAWPVRVVAPAYPMSTRGDATVIVDLRVSATGVPTSASVIESAAGFDDAAVAAARAWRFDVPGGSGPQSVVLVFVVREPERGTAP